MHLASPALVLYDMSQSKLLFREKSRVGVLVHCCTKGATSSSFSLLRPLGAAFKIPSVISLWQPRRVNAPTLGSDSAVGLRSVRWQGYMVDGVDVILLLYPG